MKKFLTASAPVAGLVALFASVMVTITGAYATLDSSEITSFGTTMSDGGKSILGFTIALLGGIAIGLILKMFGKKIIRWVRGLFGRH